MLKKEKILLYSSNLFNFADGLFGPLFAVFTERIGGNILDITWAWATYLIVTGGLSIIIGKFSDRVNKAKIIVTGYTLTTIFTFSYLLVSRPWHLFVVQAGLGVALALSNPTWMALYSEYSNKRKEGYTWGLADGMGKISTGIAIVIGGLIVNYLSFKILFVTMGILQLITTLYQAQILRKRIPKRKK